jgi:HEAT repeat protein
MQLKARMELISGLLSSDRPVTSSELLCLSGLGREELKFFELKWAEVSPARKCEIISHLVHLSETDFGLDFTAVFVCCLNDADEVVRLRAIQGLEGEDNYLLIAPLVRCLKQDSSVRVREAAATALGSFAMLAERGKMSPHYTDMVYEALLDVLNDEQEPVQVRRRALEAISPFSQPRVKELIERAYREGGAEFKLSAIYAMGRNCDLVWLDYLLDELESDDAAVRYEAANACAELGAEEAVPQLLRLVEDTDTQVQEAAIRALGEIGGGDAKRALTRLLRSQEPRIRQAAEAALEELRLNEEPLSQSLDDLD